jgi:hypothetical protein
MIQNFIIDLMGVLDTTTISPIKIEYSGLQLKLNTQVFNFNWSLEATVVFTPQAPILSYKIAPCQ